MEIIVTYCPEMNCYKLRDAERERVIIPADFEGPGSKLAELVPVFAKAKESKSGIMVKI